MPIETKNSGYKPSFDIKTKRVKVLGRLSYCKANERTKSNETSRALYRSNLLIYKDGRMDGEKNLAVAREARMDAMKNFPKWKGYNDDKLKKLLQGMDEDRRGILDGNKYTDEEGEVREHYDGVWFLKLTSDRKPKLLDRSGAPLDEDEIEDYIKSGHYAVAYYHYYCVTGQDKGGNGVFTTLDALQFFKKDETFSSGDIDDDEIDDLGEDEDADGDDDMDDKKSTKKKSAPDPEDDDDEI